MKVIFGISTKLIFMVTLIVVLAIGSVVFIATDLFKEDSITRVQEMNKDLAERLAEETFRHLEKSVDKSRLAFEAIVQKGRLNQSQEAIGLVENIITQNDDLLDLGLYTLAPTTQDKIEFQEQIFFQKNEVLAEFELAANDFKTKTLPTMAKMLAKSQKKTQFYVFNSSPLFKKPVLTVFYFAGEPGSPWIVKFDLRQEAFIKAYSKKNLVSTYWVTATGDLLVHSDPKLSMQNYNFSNYAIVTEAQRAKLDNQVMEFSDNQGNLYLGAFKKINVGESVVVAQVEKDVALAAINRVQYRSTLVAIVVVALAFLLNFSFSKSITSPLSHLYKATEKISQGQFNFKLVPESNDEIGVLTQAFSKMAIGLEERDKLKLTFSKFHSKEVAEKILKGEIRLGGEKRVATVFFSDIRGFTSMSESMSPDDVVKLLNEYMTEMVRIIKKHKGVVDKYVGDAIMALWGVPESTGQDAFHCVSAALEMREALVKFNQNRRAQGKVELAVGMGIHTGEVLAGNIGSEERLEYTVIGDTVNQASRIESLNKKLGSDILISDATVMMIKNQFEFGPSISLNVKGKSEKVVVHEIVGSRDASGHVHTVLAADVVNNLKNRDVRSLSAEESFPAPAGPWPSGTNTSGPQFRQTFEVSHPTYAPAQPVRIQTVTPQPSFAMHPPVTQTRVDLWYLVRDAQAKNPEGPYTSAQLQAMSQMPSTNLNTCFVFREGDAQMIPLFELPGMTRRTPENPGVPQGLPLPPADVAQRTPPGSWLVYTPDGNLYGPYNFMQLDQMLQSGHLNRFSYVWQPGLHYWIYINQIPGFERRAG